MTEHTPVGLTKVALITGATSGIGFHTAAAIGARGFHVFITGRDEQRGVDAVSQLRARACTADFLEVDHATRGGNRALAEEMKRRTNRLDVLVNNVGALFARRELTADGLEATLAVNFAGPALLTRSLSPLLEAAQKSRVVNVVSSALFMWKRPPLADLAGEDRYVGIEAHAHAKLLNAIWTVAFARKMAGRIVANVVNPGMAWTPLTQSLTPEAVPAWRYVWPLVRFFQRRASAEGASMGPVHLACSEEATNTGHYFDGRKLKELPSIARDEAIQERVWELAVSLGENH